MGTRSNGSNKYPKSMFLSRNKKNNVYSCKPQFYYVKGGFKRVKIIHVSFFVMEMMQINSFSILLS